MMDKPVLTPFDRKVNELCKIQREVTAHLCKLNRLKSSYMDWFNRKHQSFLDSVKSIQVAMPQLLPREISSIRQYRTTLAMAKQISTNGRTKMGIEEKMAEYLCFWDDILTLKQETDQIYEKIDSFCETVTRLREPEIKDDVDKLYHRLSLAFSEDYDFTHVHNEKDNLFTYKVSSQDQHFLGLVGYIPYLLTYATKLCYWSGKLNVEKE